MNTGNFNFTAMQDSSLRRLTTSEQEEIIEVFDMFDLNKDDYLDIYQLGLALRAFGFEIEKSELLALSNNEQLFKNGKMSKPIFSHFMEQKIRSRNPEDEIRAAFKLFDINNKGAISVNDLAQIANELGENMNKEELQAMINEFDLNENGLIDFNEFDLIMKSAY